VTVTAYLWILEYVEWIAGIVVITSSFSLWWHNEIPYLPPHHKFSIWHVANIMHLPRQSLKFSMDYSNLRTALIIYYKCMHSSVTSIQGQPGRFFTPLPFSVVQHLHSDTTCQQHLFFQQQHIVCGISRIQFKNLLYDPLSYLQSPWTLQTPTKAIQTAILGSQDIVLIRSSASLTGQSTQWCQPCRCSASGSQNSSNTFCPCPHFTCPNIIRPRDHIA